MTTDAHDHARSVITATSTTVPATRSRWLAPGLAVVIAGAGLVLIGIIPASTAISAALIAGMVFMHLGGHGSHGGATAAGDAPPAETGRPGRRSGCH